MQGIVMLQLQRGSYLDPFVSCLTLGPLQEEVTGDLTEDPLYHFIPDMSS